MCLVTHVFIQSNAVIMLGRLLLTACAVGMIQWQTATAMSDTSRTTTTQPSPVCSEGTILEDLWLVEQLNVTYSENPFAKPANASFTITHTLTNATERVDCSLRANYLCEIDGTSEDNALHIWLQINLDLATFTLNRSLDCGGEAGSPYV